MPRKKQVSLAEMKVGIFVTIALLLLAILILQQSWGVNWFAKSEKAITYLSDVGGLKSGAPVWLAGIEIGRVHKIAIVPPEEYAGNAEIFRRIEAIKGQIDTLDMRLPAAQKNLDDLRDQIRSLKEDVKIDKVELDIRPQFMNRISKDSEVSIESRGLIGDSFIDISPGTFKVLPPKNISGYYVIESLQHPGFREIMTGANDVVANFGVLSAQFKEIVKKLNPDKVSTSLTGTMHDAQTAVRKANDTFSRASALIDDLHSNKGTFGKIVSDPELYQRLTESLEKFNSLIDNIQNGKGTIGSLINDPSLFKSADEAFKSADETLKKANEALKKAELIIDRIEKGEGTLGKLSKDEALYEKTKNAFERFATLVDDIDQGKGTMGKLLKDPSLYNNLDQSSTEISKFLYDLRKDPKKYLSIRVRIF
jgi:phospholipid/cholesterol/gamma-HCH transport system substrate-binding protein